MPHAGEVEKFCNFEDERGRSATKIKGAVKKQAE